MINHTEEDFSIQPQKKSQLLVRFLKRIIIILLIALILLIGTVFVIGKFYQDEVKEFIITQVNKQLNTQIIVDGKDIDFTVIKNFPLASLDFKNIKALDALSVEKKDTLFSASEISLQFNIMDIFHKNYRIKKIELNNATVKLKIDKKGNDNYHFWKAIADTANTDFSFALEEIILNKVQLSYINKKLKQNIQTEIKKGNISGEFSTKKYILQTTADMYCKLFQINKTDYLKNKNLYISLVLNVDNELKSYKIKDAIVNIENLTFNVFGNVLSAAEQNIINLGVKGKNMDIKSFLSLIPNEYKSKINDYESDGEFYFNSTIQGTFANNQTPLLTADFGIKKAKIKQIKNNILLSNVNVTGHYSSGNAENKHSSELILDPFSVTINNGSVDGVLELHHLDNPSFKGKIKANISLDELQKFIKIDTVETINGNLKADISFEGRGKNISTNFYQSITTEGYIDVAEMNLKLKNNNLNFTNIDGRFQFDNDDVAINNFSGKISSSDFALRGYFRNVMNYLIKESEDIDMDATLISKNINLNEILTNKNVNKSNESKYKLRFSEHINANLNCEIENIIFRRFNARNIKGVIKLNNKKLVADPIVLNTMDGNISTSGLIDGTDSTKLIVTCVSDMNRINISKMFEQFENFGQTSITDKNIKGNATAKVQFASVLSPELKMDLDKLYATVDMSIENGELINVDAMKKLSRFVALEDLQNVRFLTLKNQIEIKNQLITIPKMEVKSNALNLTASGTHTFKNEINYKIKLSLNELLSKKAKQAKKENDEFGTIADDGLGRTNIFLSMTGNLDKPLIKYDSKSAIQNVKEDLKVEKQTLKSILKDEFGLFKKDSTVNKNKIKQEDAKFKIQWDELEKKEEKKQLQKTKPEDDEDY